MIDIAERFFPIKNGIAYAYNGHYVAVAAPTIFFKAKDVLYAFNYKHSRTQPREPAGTKFYKDMGITPTIFMDRCNRMMRKHFPVPNEIFTLMYRGKRPLGNVWWWTQYKSNIAIYNQVLNDGLNNLIPIVLVFGQTPQELKRLFGKGLWKVISNNSKTRNMLLMEAYMTHANISLGISEPNIKILTAISKISTTVLKVIARRDFNEITYHFLEWVAHAQKHFPTKRAFAKWIVVNDMLVIDTYFMAHQEGSVFNIHWGPKRIVEEHNRLSRQIAMKSYSDEAIRWFKGIPKTILEYDDWRVELLRSPLDIAQEAMCMKHCVASYIPRVQLGTYAVFSLQRRGNKYATIGLKSARDTWVIDQVKGPKNSDPKDLDHDVLDRFIEEARRALLQPQTFKGFYLEDEICF